MRSWRRLLEVGEGLPESFVCPRPQSAPRSPCRCTESSRHSSNQSSVDQFFVFVYVLLFWLVRRGHEVYSNQSTSLVPAGKALKRLGSTALSDFE